MSANYYKDGSYNVCCDLCGKKRKSNEVKKTYNGFIACSDRCWYPKPKNELPIPVIIDSKPVPNPRESHVTYLPFPPITKWTDSNLRWTDIMWRWDDNPSKSNGLIYIGGQWIQT